MDLEKNKSLLSDLIQIAMADGKIDEAELDFIHRIGSRMGIEEKIVEALFQSPEPSVLPLTEIERMTHFHKLLLVMNVDRETHEKEVVSLRNFGLRMGIHPGIIDAILLRMNNYEDKIIPSEELIAIFRTYYN